MIARVAASTESHPTTRIIGYAVGEKRCDLLAD